MADARGEILVIGATGYVGGRLVPALLEAGYAVRAGGRSIEKITARPWGRHPNLKAVHADVGDEDSLVRAMEGCRAAYYLVHSMHPDKRDFAAADREAAYTAVAAANRAGLPRWIYLGGLGEDEPGLSKHLRSRAEVGRILTLGRAGVTQLRAAMILGSGSASFEIMRYLVERLPVMLTPRWVSSRCQPICIANVLAYLTGCLENEDTAGLTLDIGGPDICTYAELFHIFAEEAGLPKRRILPVPVLSPKLSSYWMSLITPVPMALARPLAEGLKNDVVCKDQRILELVPQKLLTVRQAIRRALDRTASGAAPTCYFDVGSACVPEWASTVDPDYAGGTVFECNWAVRFEGGREKVWERVTRIGGDTGWYYGDALWRLRGALDKLLAGPGLRRGRRDPEDIRVGDGLDFWRVLEVEDGKRLMLLAEMRLPGEATLEFELATHSEFETELRMYTRFMPKGLGGILYWWAMYPFHLLIFRNMLANIAKAADVPVLAGPERIGNKRG